MPGNEIARILIGTQPKGQIRYPLRDGETPEEAIAHLTAHMPPHKAAETVWTVEETTLR